MNLRMRGEREHSKDASRKNKTKSTVVPDLFIVMAALCFTNTMMEVINQGIHAAFPDTTMNECGRYYFPFQHKVTIPQSLLRLSRTYYQRCNFGSDNRNVHSTMSVESAYRVLDLEPGASMDNVKAAYRRLALKCHPDLNAKDGAEFLRISAAYQRILNKHVISDAPQAPRARYNPGVRAYPGPVRPFNQTAVTVWGLGLAMGCVLFGAVLLWSRVENSGVPLKGPSRVIEPSSNAVKRERIAALLLEKSKPRKDSDH